MGLYDRLAEDRAIHALDSELERCKHSLWYLLTEKLHYDKLTEVFHRPMLAEWDRRRRLRRAGKWVLNEAEFWPRDYYKTTCRIGQAIQDWLWDPLQATIWWHDVEDRAYESGEHIADHFTKNKDFRAMVPDLCPAPNTKRFFAGGELRIKPNRYAVGRPPSLRCFGRGSEATGGHGDVGYLDDIIGLNVILDNEMSKVRLWFGASATNVIETGGYMLATGTRWDEFDIYSDWIKSRSWAARVRACYETDGVPDWQGEPVLYTREQIERKRGNMSEWDFASQMMNDPRPAGELLWKGAASEHFVSVRDIARLPGRVITYTDPAPANIGSLDGRAERERKDGTKNDWAVCTVRHQVNKDRKEIVLLDIDGSPDWQTDEGFDAVCTQARRWQTGLVGYEKTSNTPTDYYLNNFRDSARRVGLTGCTPFEMMMTYDGKRPRFQMLATKALRAEFLIADSVPRDKLERFLGQARSTRFAGTRNLAKFDDYYDVVSFAVDPASDRYAPKPAFRPVMDEEDYSDYRRSRVRHVAGV